MDGGPTLKRIVRSLSGLAPFQIAFIVRDLERAVREFDARLCAGPWRGWIFGPQGEGRGEADDPRHERRHGGTTTPSSSTSIVPHFGLDPRRPERREVLAGVAVRVLTALVPH